jgi:glycosyltransferase involved in cell wall biosynthesis
MGRLNFIKGPDMLLRAFIALSREFGSLHLVFAGPDEGLADSLRDMARGADVQSRVHFLGPVSGADRAGAYAASSLLAIPSRQEAMSLVALEAGICATPVLLTDQCGFNEIGAIGGGKVVNASPDSLQSGLRDLLTGGSLREMGSRLKDHVTRNYLWTAAAHKYMQLFERIAANGRHTEDVGGRWRSHTSGS